MHGCHKHGHCASQQASEGLLVAKDELADQIGHVSQILGVAVGMHEHLQGWRDAGQQVLPQALNLQPSKRQVRRRAVIAFKSCRWCICTLDAPRHPIWSSSQVSANMHRDACPGTLTCISAAQFSPSKFARGTRSAAQMGQDEHRTAGCGLGICLQRRREESSRISPGQCIIAQVQLASAEIAAWHAAGLAGPAPASIAEFLGLEALAQTPGCGMMGSNDPEGLSETAVKG